MRLIIIVLALALSACTSAPRVSRHTAPSAVGATVPPELAAVTVLVERADTNAHCTGVLVAPDIVATMAHCLEDRDVDALLIHMIDDSPQAPLEMVGRGAEILWTEGPRNLTPAEVRSDWLLVRIAPSTIRPALLESLSSKEINAAIADGATIVVPTYGGPAKELHRISYCILKKALHEGTIPISCNVQGGDSGAPVFLLTPSGPRLIGLIEAYSHRYGIGFAVSTTEFMRLLQP